MRAGLGYFFAVLACILWAASVHAAPAKTPRSARITVVQASSVSQQQGRSQHCDQLEDTEVISATYNQYQSYGPVLLSLVNRFNADLYPVAAAPLPAGRDNARINPFYRLILFPFHEYW